MSFPISPTIGQKHTISNQQYEWNGVAWDVSGTVSGDAVEGLQGQIDTKADSSQVLTDVPAGAVFTDTLTPVDNTLTSTSTTDALSAAQGKVLEDIKIDSDITESGTSAITNAVKISQANYDLLTPVATTLYVIVG